MAITYMVDVGCEVKDDLSSPGLHEALESHARLVASIKAMEADGVPRDEVMGQRYLTRSILPGGQVLERHMSVAERLVEYQVLLEQGEICGECPASDGRPFGCFGRIRFPISDRAESYLVGRARKAYQSGPPRSFLIARLKRQGGSGREAQRLRRASPGAVFERSEPVTVNLSKGFLGLGARSVASGTLFDALTRGPRLGEASLLAACHLSGGMVGRNRWLQGEDGGPPEQITEGVDILDFELLDDPDEDEGIRDIKAFFRACFVALRHHRDLLVWRRVP